MATKTAAKTKTASKEKAATEQKPKTVKKTTTARISKPKEAKPAPAKKEFAVDMNMAYYPRTEDNAQPKWRVIDAKGKVLGRMATEIADILRGKNKPVYTPHVDAGDYVVVINASQVVLTGNKLQNKEYAHYTGWIGGYKVATAEEILKNNPDRLITLAVKGMLPKNILSRYLLRKLRVYAGAEHPHTAQKPEEKK
jgi:large subunit ribosomal protein L13